MNQTTSLYNDIKSILFSPRIFLTQKFLSLTSHRIYRMSFICVFLGLLVGGLFPYSVSVFIEGSFLGDPSPYLPGLANVGINESEFLELLKIQKAFSILMFIMSPLIAFMAPHLFGGALFVSLKLLTRPQNINLDFFRVMECAAISLCPMAMYAVPVVGPLVSPVLVYFCLSVSLQVKYELVGFMKVMSIIFAMYICMFLPSASLQLLAPPFAKFLNL